MIRHFASSNFPSLASLGLIQFIDNLYIVVNFLDAAGRVGIRTSWVCRLARLTAMYRVSNIRPGLEGGTSGGVV